MGRLACATLVLVMLSGLTGCEDVAPPVDGVAPVGGLAVAYNGRLLSVEPRGADDPPTEFTELGSETERTLQDIRVERTAEPQLLIGGPANAPEMVIFLPGALPRHEDIGVGYVATPDGVWVLYDARVFGPAPEVTVGGVHAVTTGGVAHVDGNHFGEPAVVKTREADGGQSDWYEPLLALLEDPSVDYEALEAFLDAHPDARAYWDLQILVQDPTTTPEEVDEFLEAHPEVAAALSGTPRSSQVLIWSPL